VTTANPTAARLDLFHEPVSFELETTVPEPRLFTDTVNDLVAAHGAFIVTDSDKAVVQLCRASSTTRASGASTRTWCESRRRRRRR
jgi:hypothetical protein